MVEWILCMSRISCLADIPDSMGYLQDNVKNQMRKKKMGKSNKTKMERGGLKDKIRKNLFIITGLYL